MAGARWITIVLVCLGISLLAAPFSKTFRFTQPDGTVIELWGEGDDFHAVFETLDGYTVVFDQVTEAYTYANLSPNGFELLPTALLVGKDDPGALGLAKHLRINADAARKQAQDRFQTWDKGMEVTRRWNERKAALRQANQAARSGPLSAPPSVTTTGNKTALCLLIDFDDDPATIPQANIVDFCNGDNYTGYGNNGSVKKYFQDISNNLLTYSNVVTAYIRIPNSLHPKSWYNNTSQDAGVQANQLIRDAISIMKSLPNYTTQILPAFDNVTVDGNNEIVACNVFYAGGNGGVWSKGLWPHSWSLFVVGAQELSSGGKKVNRYQVTNIGSSLEIATFCHENGHMLCGFPDLYDYDQPQDSIGGAGSFCLMGYGGGDDQNPVQVCAYLKFAAGWSTVTDLTSSSSLTASVTAAPGAGFNHFYRFGKPGVSTEYYLMENRQKTGRDASLPASGIAIWHVDELGDRDNQSLLPNSVHANYELTLVQADNLWHFQKNLNYGDAQDLYYNGNLAPGYANVFNDSSAPNAHWWDGSSSGINFSAFSASAATMTFVVGSGVVTPNVSINDVTVGEGNGGTTPATFSVTLSPSGSQTVTVNFATLDGTATLADNDYTTNSGVLTFLPGTTSQTITVQVAGDNQIEATETFQVTLSNPANATLADAVGIGTITNDDTGGTLTISDVSMVEGDSGTNNAVFTVTLNPAGVQTATVLFSTSDGTATVANSDYLAASGVLTFPAGATSQTITVKVPGDLNVEPDEIFFVNLSSATNALIGDAQGVGTLLNDDIGSGVSISDALIIEGNSGNTNAVFQVTLSSTNAQTVTVDYATTAGTATLGTDFAAAAGTLTFLPGETTKSLIVDVIGDTAVEPNEDFLVNLTNAVNATISNGQGRGTIVDDDGGPVDLVVTTETNPVKLANVVTSSGGDTNLIVRGALLQGHSNANGASSGVYALLGASPHTYNLTLPGVVISSGDVLDYQTGANQSGGNTTSFGPAATPAQEALLDTITGGTFDHFDVTQLDITFDVSQEAIEISFFVVFGSDEYPEFVNSDYIDGFGIFLNGTNIAFTGGAPVNINHPDMAAIAGTELDGILAPVGNPVVKFSAPIIAGSTNNTLTFIVCDTSDRILDTTVYVSSLQANARKPSEAVPRITAVTPPTAEVGSTILLAGDNFSPTLAKNIVYFGATRATVTAATATSLAVKVPFGAAYAPITVTVDGLTGYSPVPFEVIFSSNSQFTDSSFAGKVDFPAGMQSRSVVSGDFNNDGRPDLVAANFGSDTLSIYRNTTTPGSINSGSLAPKVDFASGAGPFGMATGDLDGDGKLDLAVANYNGASVSVYRNTSPGTGISFAANVDFSTGNNPRQVAIADIDGDGRSDLVVVNEGSEQVSVFRNIGLIGILTPNSFAPRVDFVVGSAPAGLAVGDLDGDAKPDVVVANSFNGTGGNSISILRNQSVRGIIDAGSFAARKNFTTSSRPIAVALGDIDGDGKLDPVVLSAGTSQANVLRNTSSLGSVTLAARVSFAVGPTPRSIALTDLDGDGRPDLAAANESAHTVSVLRNLSTPGTLDATAFAARLTLTTANNPYGLAVEDLDRDGRPELIATTSSAALSVLRNLLKSDPPGLVWNPPEAVVYGTALSAAQLNATAGVAGTFSYTPGLGAVLDVGVHPLSATFVPSDTARYNSVVTNVSLTVTPAALTVDAESAARAYGSTNPVFTGTVNGLVVTDDITVRYVSAADVTTPVGSYGPGDPKAIAVDFSDPDQRLANYAVTVNAGTLTITNAPLTVNVNNATRAYGAADPTFTAMLVGLANSEVIGTQFISTAGQFDPPGQYGIDVILSGEALVNYVVVAYNSGTLTVTPAVLTLTATAANRTYGANNPVFTGTVSGLVGTDTVTAVFSSAATPASAVGFYDIGVGGLSGSALGRYTVVTNKAVLTVSRADLGVMPDNVSRAYGVANPVLTGVLNGLQNSDPITATYTTPAGANSPPGNYPITAVLADPAGKLANYNVTLNQGILAVTAADAPVVTLSSNAVSYTENAVPVVLSGGATVSDGGSVNFDTGVLRVDFAAGGAAEDRLLIRHQGAGVGQIGVSGANVTLGGTSLGTWSGGADGSTPLEVNLNANATPAAAQVLLRNLVYTNVSENPSPAPRTVRFVLSDGDGGVSAPATLTLSVVAVNDAPTVTWLLPTHGAAFKAPGPVTLEAQASDVDGVITQVVFYAGATPVGTNTSAPYRVSWTNVAVGSHTLRAVATDDGTPALQGTNAPAVTVAVHPAINTAQVSPNGQFELMLTGVAGVVYDVEVSSDLIHWVKIGEVTAGQGATPFLDAELVASVGQRFYRFRLHTP